MIEQYGKKLIGDQDERAVSPVIGVILMVAITVILAAVIAAFVLDIGPGDTDPTAAISIDGDGTQDVDVELTSISQGDGVAVVPNDDDIDLSETEIGSDGDFIASTSTTGAVISLDGSDEDQFENGVEDTYEFTVIAYDGEDPEDLAEDLFDDLGDTDGDEVVDALNDDGSVSIAIQDDFEIDIDTPNGG